jgi:hypothetical protein
VTESERASSIHIVEEVRIHTETHRHRHTHKHTDTHTHTSSRVTGLYFSTQGRSPVEGAFSVEEAAPEEEAMVGLSMCVCVCVCVCV